MYENRILGGIFGPKGHEVIGARRKQYSEELRNLYSSPSIIRMRISRAGHVALMRDRGTLDKHLLQSQIRQTPQKRKTHMEG